MMEQRREAMALIMSRTHADIFRISELGLSRIRMYDAHGKMYEISNPIEEPITFHTIATSGRIRAIKTARVNKVTVDIT